MSTQKERDQLVGVRLPEDILAEIRAAAKKNKISIAAFIRFCLLDQMARSTDLTLSFKR